MDLLHSDQTYLSEESLGASARARGEVDVDVVVLGRDGLLHEGLRENLAVHLNLVLRLNQLTLWNKKWLQGKGKGIRFLVLYPPKRSHDLPPLAGLYTQKPFQPPEGYSRAVGSI